MRGCATHWNACRRRAQWKTTKRYYHGIAHLKYIARCAAHLLLGGVYGALTAQRDLVPNGSATAKALDYSLKRWVALTRYLDDGAVPIDNNQVENQIRPWALGRSNWLFAGSLRSGKRAAAIMSLIQSARMNGHDPYAYLKDVLTRLPTQRASEIGQLLPHLWVPA
ncbi:IS66 family transposase [Pseudomonas putida]|uniref:IS66 family transposase n=1 Tax=Pseudomonas putida TaxID=303 RepID=UPI003F8A1CAA